MNAGEITYIYIRGKIKYILGIYHPVPLSFFTQKVFPSSHSLLSLSVAWPQATRSVADSVLQLHLDKQTDFCWSISQFVMDLIPLEAFSNIVILGVNYHSSATYRQMPQIAPASAIKIQISLMVRIGCEVLTAVSYMPVSWVCLTLAF